MKKKILFIGSEGSLGQAIAEDLEHHSELYRVGRLNKNLLLKSSSFLCGDLNDKNFCKEISKHHFDVAIYAAGVWKGKNIDHSNYTENLNPFNNFIEIIASNCKHIIFFSSSAVYDENENFTEQLINKIPKNSYGEAKLQCEQLLVDFCIKTNKDYTILRPFHISSPYEEFMPGRSHVMTDFIHKVMNEDKDFIDNAPNLPEVYIPFTWAKDISNILIKLSLSKGNQDIYNIGSSKLHSLKFLALTIMNTLGHEYPKSLISEVKYIEKSYFNSSFDAFGNYNVTDIERMIKIFTKLKLSK